MLRRTSTRFEVGADDARTVEARRLLAQGLAEEAPDEARSLLEAVIASRKRTPRPDPLDLAGDLWLLGWTDFARSRYAEARASWERAFELELQAGRKREGLSFQMDLGDDEQLTLRADVREFRLILLLLELGEQEAAWRAFEGSQRLEEERRDDTLGFMAGASGLMFTAGQLSRVEVALSLDRSGAGSHATAAYEQVLRWKGRDLLAASRKPAPAAEPARLADVRRELIDCWFRLRGKLTASMDARFRSLTMESGLLEAERDRSVEPPPPTSFDELRSSLPPGTLLLDYVIARVYEPGRREGAAVTSPGGWSPERVHLWASRREWAAPKRFDLGDASSLRRRVDELRAGIDGDRPLRVPGAGPLEPATPQKKPVEHRQAFSVLFQELLAPVETHLSEAKALVVVPDGFLHAVSFATLLDGEGRHLVERLPVQYVEGAALLTAPAKPIAGESRLLGVGDVDFGASATAPADPTVAHEAWRAELRALPGTTREIDAIATTHAAAFGPNAASVILKGEGATKARVVEELERATRIHLASHAFYLADSMMVEMLLPGAASGLALAGAASPPNWASARGLLTSVEVEDLRLEGCDLAILSACDSARGTRLGGDGMSGLRRAFRAAGARSVLSALWPIQDDTAAELVADFARRHWQERIDAAEALRQAQLVFIERARGSVTDSLDWGAFTLTGAPPGRSD